MFASVAVNDPVLVTLNGAVDASEEPSQSLYAGLLDESLATFDPEPTVISPVLAIVVSPPLNEVEESDHPPIAPLVAVTEPLIEALVAVSTPVLVTLNGAVEAVDDPAKNGYEAGEIPTAVAPSPAVREVAPIVNPPIVPAEAEMVPLMLALVAVTAPSLVTAKAADVPVLVAAPAKKVSPLLALVPV